MYSFSKLYITLTLVFPYHINCDLQHSRFSNSGEEDLTGWTSDAIFDRHNYSRVRCGILCLEDQCCEKFLYSASTRRCIGLHFMDFYSSSFENSVLTMYEGMKAYQKGKYGLSLIACCSSANPCSLKGNLKCSNLSNKTPKINLEPTPASRASQNCT